jgi:Right handed beta helix region/Fibronectin type III domain
MPASPHRMKVLSTLALICLIMLAVLLSAELASAQAVINVPGDSPTIQGAIDVANPGDTVLVAPGTYFENLNFGGKAITVESTQGPLATIIDGNQAGSVVTFVSGEGPSSVLRGFTLQRGLASFDGGGMNILSSSPTVVGNIITDNRACSGGAGISARFSSARIEGNLITNNSGSFCSGISGGGIMVGGVGQVQIIDNVITGNSAASGFGGGIDLFAAGAPTIRGNVIRANTAALGGGIYIVNQSDASIVQNIINGNHAGQGGGIYWVIPSGVRGPLLVNNTVASNQADTQGSGIFAGGFDAQVQLFNNIVEGASGQSAIYCDEFYDPAPPILMSNNVFSDGAAAYGGTCGDPTGTNGNISADPVFVDPANADYHLAAGSPSIDSGDNSAPELPAVDFDGDPRIVGGIVDQGVDEFGVTVLPSAPRDLTAIRLHKMATLGWSPPTSDGGSPILSYTVTVSDGRSVTVDSSITSVTFDAIKKKTSYTFTVVASNAAGPGDPASVTLPAGG